MNMAEEVMEDEFPGLTEDNDNEEELRSSIVSRSTTTPKILNRRHGNFRFPSVESINDLIETTNLEMTEEQDDDPKATSLKYAEPNLIT